jgi:hypothetical protein
MKSYSKIRRQFQEIQIYERTKIKRIMVNVSVWLHNQLDIPVLVGLIFRFVSEYTYQPFHGADVLAA